jgi:rRNA maturation endonuclease Nob1
MNFNLLVKKNEIKTTSNNNIELDNFKPNIMEFESVEENNDTYGINDLHKEVMMLKELNSIMFKETNPDEEIIKETNKQLKEIEQELAGLKELMESMNEMIVLDGEKLDQAEENVVNADQTIEETLPILETTIKEIKEIENKYTVLRVVGGAVVGGVLFGGVGSVFGIIPGLVCTIVGTGGGTAAGYLSKFIKI